MTITTDAAKADARAVLPYLWGGYVLAILAALAFAARYVMTHSVSPFVGTLLALFCAWIITKPLDAARHEVKS